MGFDKGHHEFHTLDMQAGWHRIPGYPPGFSEKILAGSLDEANKRGNRREVKSMSRMSPAKLRLLRRHERTEGQVGRFLARKWLENSTMLTKHSLCSIIFRTIERSLGGHPGSYRYLYSFFARMLELTNL